MEDKTKEFLVKTSVLDTLNASLCNEVAGINYSGEIISRLEKNNVLINALDEEKVNYKYHSLFSEYLKQRLVRTSSDFVEELFLRASRWYENNNIIKEAIDYSVRSRNCKNTVRLIEKFGEVMIINSDSKRLASLIESLPENIVGDNPRLCTLYTIAVVGTNYINQNSIRIGKIQVNLGKDSFRESEKELKMIGMMLAYTNEDFNKVLEYSQGISNGYSKDDCIQFIHYKVLWHVFSTLGNQAEARHYLNMFIKGLKRKKFFSEIFIETCYIYATVQILVGVGKYKDASKLAESLENKYSSRNVSVPSIGNTLYLHLGYLYFELGDQERAYRNVKKCIELSCMKIDIPRLISSYTLVARIHCSRGDINDMMSFIRKVEELCDTFNSQLMVISLIMYIARILLKVGAVEYTERLFDKYNINLQKSFDVAYEDAHLALADLLAVKGEFENAESILNRLHQEVARTERHFSYVRLMILKSLLAKQKGDDSEMVNYMKKALQRASEQGYISAFTEFGEPVAEIICKILKQSGNVSADETREKEFAAVILNHMKKLRSNAFNIKPELLECLSRREMEVLKYKNSGLTNKEIAEKLFVAESTIKKHINNINRKKGVKKSN
ncbi:LuxR C-terminal-related transcriptional regulator [Lutispora sp.]|uniref:LuxR C-terminal-related transcriptional regulator n=1 Tax=Lutispora sp. TaxID=2828727 RepID=UPI00356AED17